MLIDVEVTVKRPVHDVFEYWSNLENGTEWAAPIVERRKTTPGPVDVGTRFHAIDRFPGKDLEFDVEVVAFERDRLMAVEVSPPMNGSWEATFEPTDDGTRMALHAEVFPPGPFKVLTPLTRNWMKRAVTKDLQNFRRSLEATSS